MRTLLRTWWTAKTAGTAGRGRPQIVPSAAYLCPPHDNFVDDCESIRLSNVLFPAHRPQFNGQCVDDCVETFEIVGHRLVDEWRQEVRHGGRVRIAESDNNEVVAL